MIIALPVTTVIAQAAPSASPAPAATATPSAADTAVAARAKDLLHQVQIGKVDRSKLDDKMNAALTDAQISQIAAQLGPLGDPVSFTPAGKQTQGDLTVYVYLVGFKGVSITETYVLDADGKVAGLWFKPVQ